MPEWKGLWRKYLRGMQLLKECSFSNALHVPDADVCHCDWPVQVYYDPVNVVDSVCNVVGPSGFTMHFQGTVSDAAAHVFLDFSSSHTLTSASYARRMGFTVTPVNNPLQVEVASGSVCSSIGTCTVCLELQQLSAIVTVSVIELAKQYDVSLGENWLSHHNATMSWEHQCCVVSRGGRKFTFVQSPRGGDTQHDNVANPEPFSAMQARRAIGRGCRCFGAVSTDAQVGAHCVAASMSAVPVSSNVHLMPESELNALLEEYADSFLTSCLLVCPLSVTLFMLFL